MSSQSDVLLDVAANDPTALIGADSGPADPVEQISGTVTMLVEDRHTSRLAIFLAAALGFAAGLLLAVALIPDQPDRIIVPVEQPAGVQAPPSEEWSA